MTNLKPLIETGSHDPVDLINFSGLKEYPSFVRVERNYLRVVYISAYPFVATSGWLDGLIGFQSDSDLSLHITEIRAFDALQKLERKITEMESVKRSMIREGRLVGSDITDPLESAIGLRDAILRGQQKLFQISIYISLRASNLAGLNKSESLLKSVMNSKLFYIKTAEFQQKEGIKSTLALGINELNKPRNLDTGSLALTFPFISSEIAHSGGVLYGLNVSNDSLVIIDRFSLQNANSIIFAQSGSGKSYLSKIEIIFFFITEVS
jgi:hypothetical protein